MLPAADGKDDGSAGHPGESREFGPSATLGPFASQGRREVGYVDSLLLCYHNPKDQSQQRK